MRVYYRPRSGRPMRVAWTLEEIGVPYDAVGLSSEETKEPAHLARHPLGRVPVLEQDDQTVFESAAVCLQLADEHPEAALIPPLGSPERAEVYQWTIFAMTEVEPPVVEVLVYGQSNPERAQAGLDRFKGAAAALESALEGREFLAGDSLTVADIVTGGVLGLARMGGMIADYPNLDAYLDRLVARPGFQRAVTATESLLAPA